MVPADWARQRKEVGLETPPGHHFLLNPTSATLLLLLRHCNLCISEEIPKRYYQSIQTMVPKELEFSRNLMLKEGKDWSPVPMRGGTCLLKRNFIVL